LNQFTRIELQLGKEALVHLSKCRVAVFGIGGVGGFAVEALVRSGIGALDIFDNDTVSLTNLNRQIIATNKTIGLYKVDVMKERILDINPNCIVTTHKIFLLPENSSEIDFTKFDYVIDAVDTVAAKIEIILKCIQVNVPVISAMGAGNKLDPTKFIVTDIYKTSICPLARVMRHELKKRGVEHLKVVYSTETPTERFEDASMDEANKTTNQSEPIVFHNQRRPVPGSNAFVPSVCGLIAAGEVIKDLSALANKQSD
jgi:tRNA threonylcarbamoyladenosine dehydratase